MKTKLFLSIVIALVVSSNLFAGNPKTKVYTNIVNTETGYYREYTIFNSFDMQDPVKRSLSIYGTDGVLREKITYEWDGFKGWVENNKREYTYSDSDKLVAVVFTRWDKNISDWSRTSEVNTFQENRADATLIVNKSTVNTSTELAVVEIE